MQNNSKKLVVILFTLFLFVALGILQAQAKPSFINLIPDNFTPKSCSLCHTSVPNLNKFGEKFDDNGRNFTGLSTRDIDATPSSDDSGDEIENENSNDDSNHNSNDKSKDDINDDSNYDSNHDSNDDSSDDHKSESSGKRIKFYNDDGDSKKAQVISKGRVLIPVKELVKSLGGTITWIAKEHKVIISLNGKVVELVINKKAVKVNGKEKTLDVEPQITKLKTMVPLRFITESLGYNVSWKAGEITVFGK